MYDLLQSSTRATQAPPSTSHTSTPPKVFSKNPISPKKLVKACSASSRLTRAATLVAWPPQLWASSRRPLQAMQHTNATLRQRQVPQMSSCGVAARTLKLRTLSLSSLMSPHSIFCSKKNPCTSRSRMFAVHRITTQAFRIRTCTASSSFDCYVCYISSVALAALPTAFKRCLFVAIYVPNNDNFHYVPSLWRALAAAPWRRDDELRWHSRCR